MPAKKSGLTTKRLTLILIIAVALVSAYSLYRFFSPPNENVPAPSPSSFKQEMWMSFIPTEIESFRFMNITELAKFKGLFTDSVVLSIPELQLNLTISEVKYVLEVETPNNMIVNILGMNATVADKVAKAFVNSSLPSTTYKNTTIYKIKTPAITQERTAWISIFNGAAIYCEGGETALQAIKSVVDASAHSFFNTDASKVGYLLTHGKEPWLAFSFFKFEENDLKIRWAMFSVFGSSELTKRELFCLASKDDVNSKYQDVVQSLLLKSKRVYKSENFIIGEFIYPPTVDDIRTVLMGM